MLRGKVRAARAATKDNMNILISTRFDDRGDSLLCNTHERMRVSARAHRVYRDFDTSVCAVFEPDRERYTRGEFAMELRLSSTRTNRTPGDEVIDVLRGNSVEKLRANGNAEMGEVTKKLTRKMKSLIYLKRTIDGRIIDKAFPANRRARFLNEEGKLGYQG